MAQAKKAKAAKKSRTPVTLRFPCIQSTQGVHVAYLLSVPAKKLWSVVQINKRVEAKDEGYQRALSEKRRKDIATFIDRGHALPNTILVSFDHAHVSKDGSTISIDNRPDAGWVIDGQHRIAGAELAKKEIDVPVIALLKRTVEEQIELFVTINREQKGVPTSLYYELLPKLPGTRSEVEVVKLRATDLAHELTRDESSPFFNAIVSTRAPSRLKGEISLTQFIRKLVPHLKRPTGALANYIDEDRVKIMNSYYSALQRVFPDEFRKSSPIFFQTLGFGSMMSSLPQMIHYATLYFAGLRVTEFVKVFAGLEGYDLEEMRGIGTGSAAENSLSQEFVARVEHHFIKNRPSKKIMI